MRSGLVDLSAEEHGGLSAAWIEYQFAQVRAVLATAKNPEGDDGQACQIMVLVGPVDQLVEAIVVFDDNDAPQKMFELEVATCRLVQ